jgi:hypothetical protein
MERRLWTEVVSLTERFGCARKNGRFAFSDADIVQVYVWAVVHDRPVCWACRRESWPLWEHRRRLPSASQMSRRLRTGSVTALLGRIEQHRLRDTKPRSLIHVIDGKPLAIGAHSGDRQAGYGRAAGGMAKGYKIHVIYGPGGEVAAWRVAPMNVDERRMAWRLLLSVRLPGYLLADMNYDNNRLFRIARWAGAQLVVPRRYGSDRGLGHKRHDPARLRSKAMLESPSRFGWDLLRWRDDIERFFGNLTSFGGGLGPLPAWVRTHERVRRWVQTKLVLNDVRASLRTMPVPA